MNERGDLPTGTVTFLFSDIEGSTRLVQQLGERFTAVLEAHNELLRRAFEPSGTVVRTEGDAFFVAFPSAPQALAAAIDAQDALSHSTWPDGADVRVRIGMHTGVGALGGDDYVGIDVHRAARITAAGHGGQVLLSAATHALVEHDLPAGVTVRDLGEHRLKDLAQPERVYDVVHEGRPADFPPLNTLTPRTPDLPTQGSPFLGRETELAAISELLAAGGVRLLTLIGPGGIGKTRLALEVARAELQRFDHGEFFVELETVRDPEGVFDAIIRAAGLSPTNEGRPVEALARQLERRSVLLLLDNVEQVIDAADGVAELLRLCPLVTVLATSREALAVRDETTFVVPPLSTPAPATGQMTTAAAEQYEAVRLFVARAEQARPGFTLTNDNAAAVADVCARLDGLPLAIELAAARVKLFSPQDLRDRLDSRLELLRGGARDLPARQRTLRGAIAWSYELLDADECALFALLSVFTTARLVDVETVAAKLDQFANSDVLDLLTSLVDKSLVRSVDEGGQQRLAMLDTIREYAAERLAEVEDLSSAARHAHAEHFCDMARGAHSRLDGPERDATLDELDAELGNLRTAWSYWLAQGNLQVLDELLGPLWVLHDARGRYKASVDLAQELLAALSAVPSTPEFVELKVVLAVSAARGLMAIRGYTKEVDEAYRAALELLSEAGGLPQLFPVLRSLADLHLFRAEFDKAAVIGQQLLELAERQHEPALAVDAHIVVGVNLASMGDMPAGRQHLEQAIALFDSGAPRPPRFRLGASPGVVARTTSSFQLWLTGYPDQAVARADEALALADQLAHPFTLAYALFHVGYLALWQEDFDLVLQRATSALAVAEEHDYPIWRALALILQGVAMTGRDEGDAGLAQAAHGISLYQGLDTPPVFWPLLLTMRARSYGLAGRPAEGLDFIDQAIDSFAGRFNFLYPEMPLLKGDLLLTISGPAEAEPWFTHAFTTAEQLGARMTQLRAAVRLTRLARAAGATPDGSDRLQAVYDTFTEGSSAASLVAARSLLAE